MGQAAYVYPTAATVDRHIERINAARRASAVLEAVRAYLVSWPAERVARLQCADAGWAPFDAQQKPLELHSTADVEDAYREIHRHCKALRESGLAVPPELLELDRVLRFAHQRLWRSGDARAWAAERRTGRAHAHA
jgi:hypothetical protein